MTWWQYLICFICFMLGKIQAAYSIIIPMICVNFALPFAKEIEENTGIATTKIKKRIKKTIRFWFFVNTIALFILFFVPFAYFVAYAIGTITIIFSIGQTKKNPANLQDFYQAYMGEFMPENKERVDDYLRKKGYIA